MKRVLCILLTVLIVFGSGILSVGAEENKISSDLRDVIDSVNPDEIIPVTVTFNTADMLKELTALFPGLDKAADEYAEALDFVQKNIIATVFGGIDFETVAAMKMLGNAVVVRVKASDIKKLAEYDVVMGITYYPEDKLDPELKKMLDQSAPDSLICVRITFDGEKTHIDKAWDLLKYSDLVKVYDERKAYYEQKQKELLASLLDDVNVKVIEPLETFGNSLIAEIKAIDLQKILTDDLIKNVSYYADEIKKRIGDADGDGDLTILDATRIQRFIAELIEAGDLILSYADFDGDGEITILDATAIQRALADLIPQPTV